MILLVLCVCLAAELHQSEGSLSHPDATQQKEIVDAHNKCRRGAVPTAKNMLEMTWDDTTAAFAQEWANKCTQEHSSGENEHGKYGENLFMSSAPVPWSRVVDSWDDEKKDFQHGVGATSEGAVIGHYTQVVWYSTHKLGCGSAYCPGHPKYQYYYVCQYSPPGNVRGRIATPYAEGPPCGACPNDCKDGLCTNPCLYKSMYSNCDQLVASWGCEHPMLHKDCEASCKCTTEIK